MLYHVSFTIDRDERFPPLAAMHQFEGDTPMQAIETALRTMPPPVETDGTQFWAHVVIGVENGAAKWALTIPVVRQVTLPIDFAFPLDCWR
jgi:hypothetical protein